MIHIEDLMEKAFNFMDDKEKFVNTVATLRGRHSHLKWANRMIEIPERGSITAKTAHLCSLPGCSRPATLSCSFCIEAKYCSISCRELHWAKEHVTLCKKNSPNHRLFSRNLSFLPNLGTIKSFLPRKLTNAGSK